jgi:hypothetical protein
MRRLQSGYSWGLCCGASTPAPCRGSWIKSAFIATPALSSPPVWTPALSTAFTQKQIPSNCIAPLLGEAIRRIHGGQSITTIFAL